MGKIAPLIALLLCCNVATASVPEKNDYAQLEQWVQQMREMVAQQGADLAVAKDELAQTQQANVSLSVELGTAQTKMNQVGQERDGWKKASEKQAVQIEHEKKIKWQLISALIVLLVLNGVYAFLKFYLRIPFL
jgi:membrane-bound lytic murein transglycosylase B